MGQPIKNVLSVQFDKLPNDDALKQVLGYWEIGNSSNYFDESDEDCLIRPSNVNITGLIVFTAIPLVVAFVFAWLNQDVFLAVLGGLGALIILPFLVAVFGWLNQAIGDEPFVRFNSVDDLVEIPRCKFCCAGSQVVEIVSVQFGGDHYQVALLVENDDGITYQFAYTGGDETFPHRKLAQRIGCGCRELKCPGITTIWDSDRVGGRYRLRDSSYESSAKTAS